MSKYTLFELVPKEADAQSQLQISPFVFKTICDLAILGIPYDSKKLTFIGIRNDLAKLTNNQDVTVPTLEVKQGEYITNSFDIAEWLEAHHGTAETSLLPERHFARFLNFWSDTVLAPALKNLFRPLFYLMQDEASQEYFVRVKNPGGIDEVSTNLDNLRDPARVEIMAMETRAVLALLEKYLAKSGGPFILGTKPTRCDSELYGWYGSSQVNKAVVDRLVWEHKDLPRVAAWVKAINGVVGFKFDFVVPGL